MSSWRVNEKPPTDFVELLYADDDELPSDSEHSDIECDESYSRPPTPEAADYSPQTSPARPGMQSLSGDERARSRSPIWHDQTSGSSSRGAVLHVYDQDGMLLDADDVPGEIFLTADSHAIFETPIEESSGRDAREREKSGRRSGRRGGQRGDRGGQGRNARRRGQYRGRRGGYQWEVGHPLNEIWTTDDDLPPELVSLVRDVVRNREMRMQEANEGERNRPESTNDSENEDDNDEFLDASGEFEWHPMGSFAGKEEVFLPERTGSTQIHQSPYDAFRAFWDDGILGLIVDQTNQYARKIGSAKFKSEWFDTNIHEVLCLFSFWMMLGIVRMPTVISCFSTDPLLKTEVFRRIFTRRRFENLTRALHFIAGDTANVDPSNINSARDSDRLYRLRPIITHLNAKFQSNYILDKDICIDESLTLWKGRLGFKQYIPGKAAKFGIKTFELCESATGYMWSFLVYTGKKSSVDLGQAPGVLKSIAVVKTLMGPLLNKGYRLFMDNWYNSPLLARFLKRHGTDCVGTLRPDCRNVPALINKAPLKRGEIVARHSGDVSVLSWQDKRRVTMISTCHGSSVALPRVPSRNLSRPVPFKPQVVLDYTKFMGGVDLKDQLLEPYLLERKRCPKWYMKLFKRLLNVSILNSRTLLKSSTQKAYDHLSYRLQLVDSILTRHLPHCPLSRRHATSSNRSQHQELGRLTPFAHWPSLMAKPDGRSSQSGNYRKHCVVCLREGRKSIRTTFCCETCLVPLCIGTKSCFKSYHGS